MGVSTARPGLPQEPVIGPPQTIILPQRVVAGESASLAVLDAAGRLVPGAAVYLTESTKLVTDATGRAVFVASAEGGSLAAHLDPRGPEFTAAILPPPKGAEGKSHSVPHPAMPPRIASFPRVIALGDRFALEGDGFRGNVNLDRVLVGEQSAIVLAASPVSVVALANPRTALGATQIRIEILGAGASAMSVTVVSLAVSGPAKTLSAGSSGALTVSVVGSTEPLDVEVRNLVPNVVTLPGGSAVQLKTSGGEPNVATVELTGVRGGDYSVSARLLPVISVLPTNP